MPGPRLAVGTRFPRALRAIRARSAVEDDALHGELAGRVARLHEVDARGKRSPIAPHRGPRPRAGRATFPATDPAAPCIEHFEPHGSHRSRPAHLGEVTGRV